MPRGRPRKIIQLPAGFRFGQPVKIRSDEHKEPKLGLISEVCKKDGGIIVWLTGESIPGFSVYACIQPERGDTIEAIEV